jgi:anti-anti-sigma factor
MMLDRKIVQDIAVLDVAGDIDFREMTAIKKRISSLIQKDQTKVVLNLRAVDYINHLSIGVLIDRLQVLRSLNGDLKLSGMSGYLREIFRSVGAEGLFENYPSLEDAVQSFDSEWEGDQTCH